MKKSLLLLLGTIGLTGISNATTCGSETLIPATPTMPYTQSLTCGLTNDVNSSNVSICGSTSYVGGQEALYSWTPSLDYTGVTIAYTGQTWTGIFIWAGCPTSGGTCIANITSSTSSKTLNVPVTLNAGTTYFIMFDTWPAPNSPCPGSFTLNGTPVIPTPPTPTQAAGTPDCITGSTLEVAGTPPADMVWYWQTSASGTDMSNPYTGPYNIFANGIYYLRTYSTAGLLWSDNSSSITVTNFPVAATPFPPYSMNNPACITTGVEIFADPAPGGMEYYWQETNEFGSSDALPATASYTAFATGTYYLAAYDITTQCWSATNSIDVIVDDFIPSAPIAPVSVFNICSGVTSQPLEANAYGPSTNTAVTYTLGNGSSSYNTSPAVSTLSPCAIPVSVSVPVGAIITGVDVSYQMTATGGAWMSEQRSYLRCVSSGGTGESVMASGTGDVGGVFSYNRTGLNIANAVTSTGVVNFELHVFRTWGGSGCNTTYSYVNNNSLVITVYYNELETANWYDAPTAGTNLGSGSPYEAIGTSVLPSPAASGSYSFFAGHSVGTCEGPRTEIIINVNDVVVDLSGVAVTCNNGNDGSFTLDNTICGTAPFEYSVDGGPYGPIPTNLTVGDHDVVVKDDNDNLSASYIINVGNAPAPNALMVVGTTNDNIDITWTAGGSETDWHIEWGPSGFTPGTGTEVGSANANTNSYSITGLSGYTTYDIYVAADCGSGTTAGDWILVSETTMCDPFDAQAFCESFDSGSPTQPCWTVLNENLDADAWDMNYTFNTYSGDQTAAMYTDFNGGNNDDWLITPQLILTNNEIFSFYYRVQSAGEPNDMEVLMSTTGIDPADFTTTLVPLTTYSNTTYSLLTLDLSAYSGEVFIAFHIPSGGLDGWRMYVDQVCIDICTPDPGVDGSVEVCRLDNTLDLNSVIVQGESNGVWEFIPNPIIVSGSDANVSLLPNGTYNFEYIVTTACTTDTTVATVTIHPASSAGVGSTISDICSNHTAINLVDGLSGTIDLGGVWTNNSGEGTLTGSVWNPALTTLSGSYTFDYVVSNGVCPNDTSTVTVDIIDCTEIGENENSFISVYPNPFIEDLTIANLSIELGVVEVMDMQGKIVQSIQLNGVYGNYVLNMNNLEAGMYVVRITTENSTRETRVVKQ